MYSGIKKQEIQLFLVPHSAACGNYKITVQESLRTVASVKFYSENKVEDTPL